MNDVTLVTNAITHQVYAACLAVFGRNIGAGDDVHDRDRGAVSLEQVLWFVAAGVSVAVIAAILWGQIKDKADDPVITPSAP
jgi:hypothetical protein